MFAEFVSEKLLDHKTTGPSEFSLEIVLEFCTFLGSEADRQSSYFLKSAGFVLAQKSNLSS